MSPDQDIAPIDTGLPRDVEFQRWEMHGNYRSAVRTMSIDLHIVENGGSNRCQVNGTIVPTA